MKENINFLYCFDKNYNLQAFTSMISILDNSSIKINIYIIHSEKEFILQIPPKILNHHNLNYIKTYQFKDYDYEFPNINNSHVSIATYYRLFIKNYLPESEKFYVFLDPDVICIQDPIKEIENTISQMIKTKYIISAKTEHCFGIDRLNVTDKYFNAGVMIINFDQWITENLHEKLILNLIELKDNIVQWDQDVLNSLLNGEYFELSETLNFKAFTPSIKTSKNQIFFIHYMGSHKPWLTSGIFQKDSNFYHLNFKKIKNINYHIVHKWRLRSLTDFILAILTFKIFRLENPLLFTLDFINSLLNNKKFQNYTKNIDN